MIPRLICWVSVEALVHVFCNPCAEEMLYSNWSPGQPTDSTAYCVVMSSANPWLWKTADCADRSPVFVCQQQGPSTPTLLSMTRVVLSIKYSSPCFLTQQCIRVCCMCCMCFMCVMCVSGWRSISELSWSVSCPHHTRCDYCRCCHHQTANSPQVYSHSCLSLQHLSWVIQK